MDKIFMLTVAVGTILIKSDGKRQTLDKVPENAQELWEGGSRVLLLKKDAAKEFLAQYSKANLEKILEARKHLKYKAEIKLLEDAIKATKQTKSENS